MTKIPEDHFERVPRNFLAAFVVLVLLTIAILNLPPFTPTPAKPYIIASEEINVRSGPSSTFNPPIGSLKQNERADLLAISLDGQWFKIKYGTGSGWVMAAGVKPSVDLVKVLVEVGPATPIFTPSPVTPTATATLNAFMTPSAASNLVLGNINFTPPQLPLICGKTVEISVDVTNIGSASTTFGSGISIRDIVSSNGLEVGSTSGAFGPIQNGQTVNISGIFLLITAYTGEEHKLIITINPDEILPETSYSDNSREFTYILFYRAIVADYVTELRLFIKKITLTTTQPTTVKIRPMMSDIGR